MNEATQPELKGLETFFLCMASHPPVSSCRTLGTEAHLGSEEIKVSVKATSAANAEGKEVNCGSCGATMTVISVIRKQIKIFRSFHF